MKHCYSAIESADEILENIAPHEEEPSSVLSANLTPKRKKSVILLAVTIGIAFLISYSYTSFTHRESEVIVRESPLMGEDKIPDCTVQECFSSGCPESAPYKCHSNNGCSGSPWEPGSCLDQCTLEHCTYKIPPDSKSCEGAVCSAQHCQGYQKCGSSAPFQCLNGSANNGCSGDEFGWTVRSGDNICSECCDTRTCPS